MPHFFHIKLTIFLFATCQRWPCQKMCTLFVVSHSHMYVVVSHSVLTICLFWSFFSIVLKNHSHICVLDLCLWLILPDGHTFFTFLTGQYLKKLLKNCFPRCPPPPPPNTHTQTQQDSLLNITEQPLALCCLPKVTMPCQEILASQMLLS